MARGYIQERLNFESSPPKGERVKVIPRSATAKRSAQSDLI